jgi:hypothetical protein
MAAVIRNLRDFLRKNLVRLALSKESDSRLHMWSVRLAIQLELISHHAAA